ncbi:MAG: L,D-transpeptidase family protein, partial [Phycisphaerae bacterium]
GERARLVREKMADLAGQTIFSPRPFKDDPLTEFVIVRPGETLRAIAGRFTVTEEFIAFVNHIRDKNLLREGQRLKLVHGPFHVTVSKPEHVLDLYLRNHYLRSFRVALGVGGSTPSGTWRVANRQEDPGWVDPQTGQRWHPSDPNNPIGEHWIGLTGLEGECAGRTGYGIHGTIDPVSIGQDVSMGCIRLAPEDAALLYRVLQPGQSYVIVTD